MYWKVLATTALLFAVLSACFSAYIAVKKYDLSVLDAATIRCSQAFNGANLEFCVKVMVEQRILMNR
ncbi:MAG: hypothetical protein AAB384_00135 [Patescibacteria group bacterium]